MPMPAAGQAVTSTIEVSGSQDMERLAKLNATLMGSDDGWAIPTVAHLRHVEQAGVQSAHEDFSTFSFATMATISG